MPRLYHPSLGVEKDFPDDDSARVAAESGWLPAPEPAEPEPGLAAEPVRYEPVKTEKPKAKKADKTDTGDGAEEDQK